MKNKDEEYIEIDLLRLLRAMWQRIWLITIAMLLCGAAAFLYARFMITPLYESSALMYVNNSSISLGSTSVSLADLSASKGLVDTFIVIMKTRLTLDDVIERAGLSYTYEQLSKMISASSVNNTEIFRITVTGPDPVEATLIANTIADVLPDKIYDILEGSSARLVDFAVVPAQKSSPSITKYTAIGLLLGFLLSAGFIVVRELFDEQIRDEEFLTENYEYSVLAVIPDLLTQGDGKGYYGGYGSHYQSAAKGIRADE